MKLTLACSTLLLFCFQILLLSIISFYSKLIIYLRFQNSCFISIFTMFSHIIFTFTKQMRGAKHRSFYMDKKNCVGQYNSKGYCITCYLLVSLCILDCGACSVVWCVSQFFSWNFPLFRKPRKQGNRQLEDHQQFGECCRNAFSQEIIVISCFS